MKEIIQQTSEEKLLNRVGKVTIRLIIWIHLHTGDEQLVSKYFH